MNKDMVAQQLLPSNYKPVMEQAKAFAPSNIALSKYWGKHNAQLNTPLCDSLSISLNHKGCECEITETEQKDQYWVNQELIAADSGFAIRLSEFLNLFRRSDSCFYKITIKTNIPIAAGLASSACGFASLVLALNEYYGWELSKQQLSILARLGSGSASRSLWQGFVLWHAGKQTDGMDSFAEPLENTWPELQIGLLTLKSSRKKISSRDAMAQTMLTSPLFQFWEEQCKNDLKKIKQAIEAKDFELLGATSEQNALTMHALMLSSKPSICYFEAETIEAMHRIWECRKKGHAIYFTEDAGPNLKLLFCDSESESVKKFFPSIEIISPFSMQTAGISE